MRKGSSVLYGSVIVPEGDKDGAQYVSRLDQWRHDGIRLGGEEKW